MRKGVLALSIISMVLLVTLPMYILLNREDANRGKRIEEPVIKKTKIVVDIGHGGNGNGTTNSKYTGDVTEKDINLEIGMKLVDKLSEIESVEVITTRTEDVFVELSERADIGNKNNADMFVSIHCNATYDGNRDVEGIETYYYKEDNNSKLLAEKVQENLILSLNKRDRGVKRENYQVLRDSENPAILVECGFLTNELEREQLSDEVYQDILVTAIVKGITEYMSMIEEG